MSWVREAQAALLLDAYRGAELRRLDDKAVLMRAGRFDDRAEQSDSFWRKRNGEILTRAEGLLLPPCPVPLP